eukprot:Opistho-1_new@38589
MADDEDDVSLTRVVHEDSDVELDEGPSVERRRTTQPPPQQRRLRFWHDPAIRKNWRQIAASFALLLLGTAFLVTAVALWAEMGFSNAIVFLVVGSLCFIPGVYQSYMIFQVVQGVDGYAFSSLPYFET